MRHHVLASDEYFWFRLAMASRTAFFVSKFRFFNKNRFESKYEWFYTEEMKMKKNLQTEKNMQKKNFSPIINKMNYTYNWFISFDCIIHNAYIWIKFPKVH